MPGYAPHYANTMLIKITWNFLVALLRLCFLEKQHENLNFYSFIISRRIVGGNFQGNACSNFQKICIWTRHDHSTFIRETSSILVAVLRVCLIIISEMLIFEEFSPLKSPLLTTLSKTRALTSRKCFAEAT